jgi:GTPase SAR1 family protein
MAFCCWDSCIHERRPDININTVLNKDPFVEQVPRLTDVNGLPIQETMYSYNEIKTLQFVNSSNELIEQITSHEASLAPTENRDGRLSSAIHVNIPRIVLTGIQSSGKSTLVNRFIGMDILPVGDNMVTRTPINIRLNNMPSKESNCATIAIFKEGAKEIIHSTKLADIDMPLFQRKIMDATDRITDNKYSISNNQIFIDISSFAVESMTIVDLPGIVSISCTDKGQPPTIVDDIVSLIKEQLEYPETYVLAVVSALTDLETDAGLAVIKRMQLENKKLRAVGVLTKSDRLNIKSMNKIDTIINNNISKNVMLDDGYFVVNNMVSDLSDWYMTTFKSTSILKKKRHGITNLKSHLKKTLMSMIKNKLPEITSNLTNVAKELVKITPKLDDNLDQIIAKLTFINNMTFIMSKAIAESFNSVGKWRNTGSDIKNTFDRFVIDTNALDPFSASMLSDDELSNIITNFVGYIPNSNDTTYLVINRCLTDEDRQPIKLLVPHVTKCIDSLVKIITNSISELLRLKKLDIYPLNLNKYNIGLSSFPKLRNFIMDSTVELLDSYKNKTLNNISHLLSIHERHIIWYDQKDFDDFYSNYQVKNTQTVTMEQMINTSDDTSDTSISAIKLKYDSNTNQLPQNPALLRMRTLLKVCFNKVVKTCQDEIYKTVASDIVKEFEHHFFIEMSAKFLAMTESKLNELFYETDEMIKNKKVYDNMMKTIEKLLEQASQIA